MQTLYYPGAPVKIRDNFSPRQIRTALNNHLLWDPKYHEAVYEALVLGRHQKHVALSLGISYATLRNKCSQIRGEIERENV
jgi:hypothetical protein